jgi:hypothetical protein
MSTGSAYLSVAGIGVDVVYKDIKNLHVSVYPPIGRVRVAAPERLEEEAIRLALVQRLPWIKRQRAQLQDAARQSTRELINGESHYVWGHRLRLEVVSHVGRPRVEVGGSKLRLLVAPDANSEQKAQVLERWYRAQLKQAVTTMVEKWEPVLGQRVESWTVRRMKTKWGSCNPVSRRLWFNLELAKKHPACLEYIVVHEMTHLVERNHTQRFIELMDQRLPNWRALRDELNGAPLAEEEWV